MKPEVFTGRTKKIVTVTRDTMRSTKQKLLLRMKYFTLNLLSKKNQKIRNESLSSTF